MKVTRFLYWLIFLTLVCMVSIPATASDKLKKPGIDTQIKQTPGKMPDITKKPSLKTGRGWCCIKGELNSMDEKQCSTKRGDYFADKSEAEKNCGFCCIKGEVTAMHPKNCSAKRGAFFRSETDAKNECTGFCCRDGKVSRLTKSQCSNKGDDFFGTQAEADKECTGWCCSNFEVEEKTQRQCSNDKGSYFGTKQQADRHCDNLKGWCCTDGKTERLSRRICETKKGDFYESQLLADRSCKGARGFCNIKKHTLRLTEEECREKGGNWFASQMLATKDLRDLKRPPAARPRPGIGPLPGPDDDDESQAPAATASASAAAEAAAAAGIRARGAFPARITEVSGNAKPGTTLTIMGRDFGERTGRVSIYKGSSAHSQSSVAITYWSERMIRVTIPRSYERGVCGPTLHTVQVFPARVAGEVEGYPYSGNEGPTYGFDLLPNNTVVSSMSPSEVVSMATSSVITITGRYFGTAYQNEDAVIKLIGPDGWYEAIIDAWSDESIAFRFGSRRGRNLPSGEYQVVVVQEYPCHDETNAGTVAYVGSNDFDLAIDRLIMNRVDRYNFTMTPVIRNNGPGVYSGDPITITYGRSRSSSASGVLRSGEEVTGTASDGHSFHIGASWQTTTVTARIDGGGSSTDDPSNNTCTISFTDTARNRTFNCD